MPGLKPVGFLQWAASSVQINARNTPTNVYLYGQDYVKNYSHQFAEFIRRKTPIILTTDIA